MFSRPHNPFPPRTRDGAPLPKVRLSGRVADVAACELLTAADRITVGSSPDCDLVVLDPLAPPHAFHLRHTKEHGGLAHVCNDCWELEAEPEARVFVNGSLTKRERLALGDTISIGCHHFTFTGEPAGTREHVAHTNVDDLCASLLDTQTPPIGFLQGCAAWRDRVRDRVARRSGVVLALIAALIVIVFWPAQEFESIQEPMVITMVVDQPAAPPPDAIKSLAMVERKTIETPTEEATPAELNDLGEEPTREMDAEAIASAMQPDAPQPPDLESAIADAGPMLDPLQVDAAADAPKPQVEREAAELARSAPARRVAVAEADQQPMAPQELAAVRASVDRGDVNARVVVSDARPEAPRTPDLKAAAVADAGPMLAPLQGAVADAPKATVARESTALARGAPARRLSVREAQQQALTPQELAAMRAKVERGPVAARTSVVYASEVTRRSTPAAAVNLDNSKAEVLAALKYEATPIKSFEDYRGVKIPVARVPEQLASMEVADNPTTMPAEIDGVITEAETATSFKTGRFTIHGPGQPPEADPATYCFVSKNTIDGKDYLEIRFDCKDPQLDALVLNHGDGTGHLAKDDSIEIFMDVDGDRTGYHQLIANARGNVFATYCANGDLGINGQGVPWDAGAVVKTTINKEAGNWVCEVRIPYEKIPGVPAKGTKIPVNFCRNFRGQSGNLNHLQNWFSVWTGDTSNYHHPSKFGLLEWP